MIDYSESPEPKNSGRNGCLRGLILLLIVVCLLSTAVIVLTIRRQSTISASGIRLSDADPSLNFIERLLLQNYLVQNEGVLGSAAGHSDDVSFTIPAGASAEMVSADLAAAGLLDNTDLFLNYLRFYGMDSHLQSGQYTLNGQLTIPQLADTISEMSAQDITLNFLPGMRMEEMAAYLEATAPAQIDPDEFLALVRRRRQLDLRPYPFLNSLPAGMILEGYLFPGAYTVPAAADAEYLLNEMLVAFDRQVTPVMRQAYGAQGLSLAEAVTLASIVERETPVDEERALIASVYANRVRNGMPLQADPTVQYAAGYQEQSQNWWKVPLSLSDLELDHPYNTYVIPGLPPGPIANPGLASLQAVAEPEDSSFLYFVLDCDSDPPGRHVFSRTYQEHLANVERCR